MAGQTTVRLGEDLTGADGTLVREIINPKEIFMIMRSINAIGALIGNQKFRTKKGVDIPARPAIIKTRKVDSYEIEAFSNQPNDLNFEITTGATAAGTEIVVTTNHAMIPAKSWMQVGETRDNVYVSANSSGTLTIERTDKAAAITVGMHLIPMGLIPGESSTNPGFYSRDDDKHYTYSVEMHSAWTVSQRAMNVKRYGGPSWENEMNRQLIQMMAYMENMCIGSVRDSGLTANSATTPRGIESWAEEGNGSVVDFGGTIEKSELRNLAEIAFEYARSSKLIGLASHRTISMISSVLDAQTRVSPNDFASKVMIPTAKSLDLGVGTIDWIPCNFYKQSGKEGQMVIFDPAMLEIGYLNDLELKVNKPFSDSTQASRQYGEWYADHCGVIELSGGKGVTFAHGANAYSS